MLDTKVTRIERLAEKLVHTKPNNLASCCICNERVVAGIVHRFPSSAREAVPRASKAHCNDGASRLCAPFRD